MVNPFVVLGNVGRGIFSFLIHKFISIRSVRNDIANYILLFSY